MSSQLMNNFEWRSRARAVAYTEQVLLTITFPCTLIICLLDASNASQNVYSPHTVSIANAVTHYFGGYEGMLLLILIKEEIIVLLIVAGFWSTYALLRGTSMKNRIVNDVTRFCNYWRVVNGVLLVLLFIDTLLFRSYAILVLEIIGCLSLFGFLCIVTMFLQEVKSVESFVVVNSGFDTI